MTEKESVKREDGSYSEIYYMDSNGEACDKNIAARCMIRNYDSSGNMIGEIHGLCKKACSSNVNMIKY